MSPKRKWLTLEEKINVLEDFAKTKSSHRQLAERFGVGKTQITNILKDRDGIYKAWLENGTTQHVKKKMKTETCELDSIMFNWFCAVRNKNMPISGPLIQEKASEVAKSLNIDGFKASNGWLQKFKIRHNIINKAICGEAADVRQPIADDCQVKRDTVHKCILTAGFSSDFEEHSSGEQELDLLNAFTCDMSVQEYLTNEDQIPVCNSSTDVQDYVAEKLTDTEETISDDEAESECSGNGDTDENIPKNYYQALEMISSLKKFIKKENLTTIFQKLSEVQCELEKQYALKKQNGLQ